MKTRYTNSHNGLYLRLLLVMLLALIGSSRVAYSQTFSDSFETAPDFGTFTLFPSPNSVTFTGGLTQTQGVPSLYRTGVKSFKVISSNTATITFETPAQSVTLWLRDQSNTSVLTIFDQNNQVIITFNATQTFTQVGTTAAGGVIGSITLQNNGSGFAVIDDFSFTTGSAPPGGTEASTILIANFMNGNNSALNSRIYLFNSSDFAGGITVRVFSLPLRSGVPQELTGAPLDLGTLGPKSAVNIKLAEDILTPLGIALPYLNDGGNLTVEFTVGAEKVRGVAQVFTSDFAFGTYPLQGPESMSVTVPGGDIPSGELPDGSVTTSKIVDGAVTGSKIANGAVGSVQLADTVTFGASSSPGQISVVNSNNSRVFFVGDSGGNGLLNMHNSTGNVTSILGHVNNAGQLDLRNSTNNTTVILGNLNNEGLLNVNDAGGNLKVALQVSNNGGLVGVNNSTGNTIVLLGNLNNEGALNLNDAGQNLKVFLGVENNGGRVTVANSTHITTAGMNGSTGLVFGNAKSFIVADPSNSNRMIKYTSVEGPEAAIYVRGTANLVSGEGHIDFPDHFAVMAVPSSITVSLTPRSASSMGLAAVSVSSQGIDVAELGGGTNSYSFDYVAYAVRKGFEDYEVYLTQEQVVRLTGQARALELRPRSLLTTSPLKAIQRQE